MTSIGIRELRQNASRYLAAVRRGESVEITDRGVPVARLVPIDEPDTHYARLVADGRLVPAGNPNGLADVLARVRSGSSAGASAILDDLRRDVGEPSGLDAGER